MVAEQTDVGSVEDVWSSCLYSFGSRYVAKWSDGRELRPRVAESCVHGHTIASDAQEEGSKRSAATHSANQNAVSPFICK